MVVYTEKTAKTTAVAILVVLSMAFCFFVEQDPIVHNRNAKAILRNQERMTTDKVLTRDIEVVVWKIAYVTKVCKTQESMSQNVKTDEDVVDEMSNTCAKCEILTKGLDTQWFASHYACNKIKEGAKNEPGKAPGQYQSMVTETPCDDYREVDYNNVIKHYIKLGIGYPGHRNNNCMKKFEQARDRFRTFVDDHGKNEVWNKDWDLVGFKEVYEVCLLATIQNDAFTKDTTRQDLLCETYIWLIGATIGALTLVFYYAHDNVTKEGIGWFLFLVCLAVIFWYVGGVLWGMFWRMCWKTFMATFWVVFSPINYFA
jgi:hypothetical protein